nr:unnamed protein product [Callosobruchus analis]
MDSLFMDQHFLRSSLRLYSATGSDPLDAENNNASSFFSAAMVEKARAQLQMWGRAGAAYNPAELHAFLLNSGHQVYRSTVPLVTPSQLWPQGATSWHPGLMRPQITPPPSSTPSSSGSPSPTSVSTSSELRLPKAMFPTALHHRFSPYAPMSRPSGPSISPPSRSSH